MTNIFSIACPSSCAAAGTMPVLPANFCQLAPKLSEIDLLIFKGTGAGPNDMSLAADWTGKIDNADATGAKMRYLIGRGKLGTPAVSKVTLARGAEYVLKTVYTMEYTVFELTDPVVYDFLRTLQCGAQKPDIYYASRGGFLYGKVGAGTAPDNGIAIKDISVSFPKESGEEAFDSAVITLSWQSTTDPDRVTNPLTL